MIISLIITALLLYVAYNTTYDGEKFPYWVFICIAAIGLASWQSAFVMLALSIWALYKGVKDESVRTLDWIQDLIK